MPLKLVIPSLLRIKGDVSSSSEPHPLHALLKPLLQTARSASHKYHVELPQILKHGGGAGEIEETTMWYALNYEQADEDLWASTSTAGQGPWVDETWRTRWIERMERREFEMQILLYFLKLSLLGPPLVADPLSKSDEGSRKGFPPVASLPSDEDRLEAFMDKLSMWQLMADLERGSSTSNNKDERDWMQVFFEEVVEPLFKSKLPEPCALLRSKIFSNSPLSPSSRSPSPSSSHAASPDIPVPFKRSKSSTRQPSPALSTLSSDRSSKFRSLERTRSRSLSISLAQERKREKERGVGLGASKKRVLNREVSMSRVFKPKPKVSEAKVTSKRKKDGDDNPAPKVRDEGVTLVADTPVKPKISIKSKSVSHSHLMNRTIGSLPLPSFGQDGDDDEEEWHLLNSSDILLLGGKGESSHSGGLGLSDGEDDPLGMRDTPSKSKRPRVR